MIGSCIVGVGDAMWPSGAGHFSLIIIQSLLVHAKPLVDVALFHSSSMPKYPYSQIPVLDIQEPKYIDNQIR